MIVLYGESGVTGLGAVHAEYWTQDTPGIEGGAEAGDGFGSSLAAGNFNGDSCWDLAVGVPYENIGAVDDAGAVHVLHGDHGWLGLESTGSQVWWQELFGYVSESDDWLGFSLAGK